MDYSQMHSASIYTDCVQLLRAGQGESLDSNFASCLPDPKTSCDNGDYTRSQSVKDCEDAMY